MSFTTPAAYRTAMFAVLAFAVFAFVAPFAKAAEENNIVNGAAAHGYDVVAYFTKGMPVPGSDEFTAQHDGVTYRFSSAEHLNMFQGNPAKYAPQYGGFCAFGTAMGRKFDGDPEAWSVVDGKLYLNLNKTVQERWKTDVPGFIKGADNNWSIIRTVADKTLEATPPAGLTRGAQ